MCAQKICFPHGLASLQLGSVLQQPQNCLPTHETKYFKPTLKKSDDISSFCAVFIIIFQLD